MCSGDRLGFANKLFFHRHLKARLRWISREINSTSATTSFSICATAWGKMAEAARGYSGLRSTSWDKDGHMLYVTLSQSEEVEIDMHAWSGTTRGDVVSLWEGIDKSLTFGTANRFSAEVLTDDHYATQGLFDRAENQAYLVPFQQRLLRSIVACDDDENILSKRQDLDRVNAFLKGAEDCRKSLMAAFLYSCSDPPEGFQFFQMIYRQADSETNRWHRNIRKYQATFLLGNPRAKSADDPKSLDEVARYWPLQPQLSRAFAYMFGVVRPVEISLMRHFEFLPEEFETFMFVKAPKLKSTPGKIRQKNWLYGTRRNDLNTILKGSEINASFTLMKLVNQAINKRLNPDQENGETLCLLNCYDAYSFR